MDQAQIGFFEEEAGSSSSMRLMCFMSLCTAMVLALLAVLHPNANPSTDVVYLVGLFLVGAFAPKCVQKFGEQPSAMRSQSTTVTQTVAEK